MEKNTEQDYLDIEAYLHGEMDADKRVLLETRATTDPVFAEMLAERTELYQHVQAMAGEAAFRDNLRSVMESTGREAKVVRLQPKAGRSKWVTYLAAAASVLLIVFAVQFFLLQDGVDLNQFSDHAPIALVERGDSVLSAEKAERLFNLGDYLAAIVPLRSVLAQQEGNVQAQLALAISLMETSEDTEARRLFTQIADGESRFAGYGKWYLALMAVRRGENDVAIRLLDELPADDTYLQQKAQQLRESL